MMKWVLDMCLQVANAANTSEKPAPKPSDYFAKNLAVEDLYKLIEQHQLYLKFLQSNTICTE